MAHDKVFEGGGTFKLPFEYRKFDIMGGQQTLDYLARAGVYDPAENTITIKNPDSLNEYERTALLLIQTGDRDVYAYAAENQYHADKYLHGFKKKHSIASDAGVGESTLGFLYEGEFKRPNGKYYKDQLEAHGDR